MPLTSGTRIGSYAVSGPLGKGGMGEVYRARDAKLGRDVAVKVLPEAFANQPERLARFQREAKVLAALNHPNIATVYALEEFEGGKALVMELVEGAPVQGPLPVEHAVKVAIQITDALEAAHDKSITHRDIKPGNILVTPQGVVKVLDFGLAAVPQDAPSSVGPDGATAITLTFSPTQAGMILGTAGYMSPEQAAGQPVDRHADIWAFGVVLYELLTGKRLFTGDSVAHVLADVLRAPIDLTPIPEGPVRDLLARCLERDLRERLHAIGEARVALQRAGHAPARRAATTPPKMTWVAAAAAFAALAAGLAFVHFRETPPELPVLRYPLELPEGTSLVHSFAISPDGKFVVIAANVTQNRPLILRSMDALQGQPMAFTEGATFPFWSPDNRYIAFFADGKLKKVPVTGGPAQVLCDVPSGRGGTWNRDDVIVFSPNTGGISLQRVSAAGGTPVDIFQDKADMRHPFFLPDGRRFLFRMRGLKGNGIYLGSLDGKENRRILGELSAPMLAVDTRSGAAHVLFSRDETLMAQPFDTKTGNPTGEAFPVSDGVGLTTNNSWLPVSASDRGTLLYERNGKIGRSQLTWMDRNGKPLGTVGAPGTVLDAAISPDGKTVVYRRYVGVVSDLWLNDLARETETRFTSGSAPSGSPAWSPHGDRIAFSSERGGATNVYQKTSNGSGQDEEVYAGGNTKIVSQWSRDGRWIVYTDRGSKTGNDVAIFPIGDPPGPNRTATLVLQTSFDESQGQISPDGHWISYMSNVSGRQEIYVQPFPSGDGKWKISVAGGTTARWSADGKELFYVAADEKMMAVPVKAAVPGPKPSFEVGSPQALFDSHMVPDYVAFQYDVASDGKRFLINAVGGADPKGAPPLTVVVNWLAGVKR